MICDDDLDLCKLFGRALESRYNVILAYSGEDCIWKYVKEEHMGNKVHLLLLDYNLGSMYGDTVARKIKEHDGTKIILITAYDLDSKPLQELIDNSCIANYVEKPIHLADLIELVAKTI